MSHPKGKTRKTIKKRDAGAFEFPTDAVTPKAEMLDRNFDYGGGSKLTSCDEVPLTLETAQAHLMLETVPCERPLSERHVLMLTEQAMNNGFRPELVTLATAKLKGTKRVFRINGQHTSWMRLELGADKRFDYPVQVLNYTVDDMESLGRLYAAFDRNSMRTENHVVAVNLANDAGYTAISQARVINTVKAGLKHYLWGLKHGHKKTTPDRLHSSDEVANLMLGEYRDVCVNVGLYLNEIPAVEGRPLMRAGVVAAMLATFDKYPRKAKEFWNVVRDGVEPGVALSKTDPRLYLHRQIPKLMVFQRNKGANPDAKVITTEEMYRGVIRCWRAWRNGEEIKSIHWRSTNPKARRPAVN